MKFALKLPAGDPRPATPVFVSLRRSSHDAKTADVTERPWDKADAMSCVLPEPGAWVVDIHVPGYSLVERSVDVKPGENADLGVLLLDRGLTLEGRVTAPDGSPTLTMGEPLVAELHAGVIGNVAQAADEGRRCQDWARPQA